MSGPQAQPARLSASAGRIYFWQGGSLWIGQGSGRTQWHAHHAHQLVASPRGGFRFRTAADGPWEDFDGAVVPSLCTHQFEMDGMPVAHLFVEPESRAGRALIQRFGIGRVSALPVAEARAAATGLFAAFEDGTAHERIVHAAQSVVEALCGVPIAPDRSLDPRLARALDVIRAKVRGAVSLEDVAAAVALSESRFRHLFVAGTGSSFRSYVLWLRINLAIEAVMAGASWTEAAHEAGFADSAHLSRTHKRMFGIEPTAITPTPAGMGMSFDTGPATG